MKKTNLIASSLMIFGTLAAPLAYSDSEGKTASCTPAQIESELSQAKRVLNEIVPAAIEYSFYAMDRDYANFDGSLREDLEKNWKTAQYKRLKFQALVKGREEVFARELECQNPEARWQREKLQKTYEGFQSIANERDPVKSAERIETLMTMLPHVLPAEFLKRSAPGSTGEKSYCSEQEIEKELGGAKKALDLAWAHALAYMGSANDYDYMNWAEEGDQELYELSRKSYSKKETYRNNFRAKLAEAKRAFSGKRDCKISHAKLAQMRFVADRLSALSDKQPTPARESDLADLVWETSRSYFNANRME